MNFPDGSTCAEVADHGWLFDEVCNIGVEACDVWAERTPDAPALILADDKCVVSYGELKSLSNKIANLLVQSSIERGDRVGVFLPQMLETAASHIGIYKTGGVAVPLFGLFGPDALEYRINNADIKCIITNQEGVGKLALISPQAREGLLVFSVDGVPTHGDAVDLHSSLAPHNSEFIPVETGPDDPAIIIYTSGTTGSPKGALHGHRILKGHYPGFELFNDFKIGPNRVIWTPADWAWIGGLFDVLLPALAHGMCVVTKRFEKFTAEAGFNLMADHAVQHAFLPPTALKLMRSAFPDKPPSKLALEAVGSGGETLGGELLDWGQKVLGVKINEFYGQTECNLIVSSCGALYEQRAGFMGKAVAGHDVAVLNDEGSVTPMGELGNIAVRKGSGSMFLEYWRNEDATRHKFKGEWMLTGDMGVEESDGWLRFMGRDDDVITSGGYRIGPSEIEECLVKHEAVQMAAVIGVPDPVRTELVFAFIVLKRGVFESESLINALKKHVKTQLSAHEYPRKISVVSELPMTATGKIMRGKLRELAGSHG